MKIKLLALSFLFVISNALSAQDYLNHQIYVYKPLSSNANHGIVYGYKSNFLRSNNSPLISDVMRGRFINFEFTNNSLSSLSMSGLNVLSYKEKNDKRPTGFNNRNLLLGIAMGSLAMLALQDNNSDGYDNDHDGRYEYAGIEDHENSNSEDDDSYSDNDDSYSDYDDSYSDNDDSYSDNDDSYSDNDDSYSDNDESNS
jgi:hypothetical protein